MLFRSRGAIPDHQGMPRSEPWNSYRHVRVGGPVLGLSAPVPDLHQEPEQANRLLRVNRYRNAMSNYVRSSLDSDHIADALTLALSGQERLYHARRAPSFDHFE
jgi:hypothetical protein